MFKKFYYIINNFKIFSLGVNNLEDKELKNKIIITNKLNFLAILTGSVYGLFFLYFYENKFSLIAFFIVILLILLIFITKLKYFVLSRLSLILCINLSIFYYANALGKEAGIQNFFYCLALVPFAIFELKHIKCIIFGVSVPIISWLILFSSFNNIFFNINNSNILLNYLQFITGLITFVVSISIIYIYINSNEHYKNALEEAYKREEESLLRENQASLALKDAQIHTLKKAMVTINHEINSPLTSVLCIIQLLKEKHSEEEKQQLSNILYIAAIKIKDIISKLTDVAHGKRPFVEKDYVSGDKMISIHTEDIDDSTILA